MNANCGNCGSIDLKNKGIRMCGTSRKFQFKCNNCGHVQYEETTITKPIYGVNYVITSATDEFPINRRFLKVLENYCNINNAKLVVIPVNNKKSFNEFDYDEAIKPYLIASDINLGNGIVIKGSIRLGTTLESPLDRMNAFSGGKSCIFGHPQVKLKTLPRKHEKYPPIMATTGSLSIPKYSETKTAQKAHFHHTFSAIFVSQESPGFLRHLNYDDIGFYDLGTYYTENTVTENCTVTAIVTGDEHVVFHDPSVFAATYGKSGLIDILRPEYIVRHDVLDCYSISHHHKNNMFVRYGKRLFSIDSIEDELLKTLKFIEDTTPDYATSIIVPSNHNNHLLRWLNECDPKLDLTNAKLYHKLAFSMLDNVKLINGMPSYPDPFELFGRDKVSERIKFLRPNDDFIIHDIDLNNHGDKGVNGSKGSIMSFRDLPNKSIVGHSHSPSIEKGSISVGTSTYMNLEYNSGLSTWASAHAILHKNGKRQLIFIYDGRWN